jgi:hypothetical protein
MREASGARPTLLSEPAAKDSHDSLTFLSPPAERGSFISEKEKDH